MKVQTTGKFDSDRERQFRWYLVEAGLDPRPALELAERFARAVDETLELVSRMPAIGRPRRLADWTESEVRSFRVHRPFNRFLIFYVMEGGKLTAFRLLEGHRMEAGS